MKRIIIISGGGATDPLFSSVRALLHFNGTHASTTITDVTGKSWSSLSPTHCFISTTQSQFGGASLSTNGNNGSYVECTDVGLTIGTSDFTMEGWIYRTGLGSVQLIWDQRPNATNGVYPSLYHDASGNLHYFVNSADRITGTGGNLPVNTWTHVAICRASGTTRLFVGGTQTGSSYADANNYLFGRMRIGGSSLNGASGNNFGGFNDEFRLTLAARYTSNFTPPSAQLPDS